MRRGTGIKRLASITLAIVGGALPSTATYAAGIWDGGTPASPDASGAWNTNVNWDDDVIPTGVAAVVQLGDVTSGTRTVTLDTTAASIGSLNITQSTAGATNALLIDGVGLALASASASTFATSQTGGTIDVAVVNGGAITYTANSNTAKLFTNAGSFTLGNAATPGNGSFTVLPSTGTNGPAFTFANNGTATFNNASRIGLDAANGSNTAATFLLTNSGTLNLAGATTTGIVAGVLNNNTNPATPTFTNNPGATVNVTRVGSETAGTGLTAFGMFDGGNQRAGATVNNNGTFNVASNARFTLQARRNNTDTSTATFNVLSAGTLNLGDSGSTTAAGSLAFQVSSAGASDNNSVGMRLLNTGTVNLYGASSVAVGNGSVALADGDNLTVTNNAAGNINLYDASSIGTAARGTLFTNAGTLTKLNAGTASVLSSGAGLATSGGTIDVQAGTLLFSRPVASSGTVKGDGTLQASLLTNTGTIAPGNAGVGSLDVTGAVTMADNSLLDIELIGDAIDVLAISGTLDLSSLSDGVTITGSGLQSQSRYVFATYVGDLGGNVFDTTNFVNLPGAAIDYKVPGEIAVTVTAVPEPGAAGTIGLIAICRLLTARHRRRN